MHAVLLRVIASACDLTGAKHGVIGVLGPGGELAEVVTRGLSAAQRARIENPSPGGGIVDRLMEHPEPLRLRHLRDHPATFALSPGHTPLATFLGVPLRVHGIVFGNLYLTEKTIGSQFTEEDELLVQALATAAGLVVENARDFAISERRREWLEASVRMGDALQPPIQPAAALKQVVAIARSVTHATTVMVMQRTRSDQYFSPRETGHTPAVGPSWRRACGTRSRAASRAPGGRPSAMARRTPSPWSRSPHTWRRLESWSCSSIGGVDSSRSRSRSSSRRSPTRLPWHWTAQAMEDREDLAVISDRDRIARDLHELVIQRVFATGLQLQGAGRMTAERVVAQRIDQTVIDLDGTIRDIRSAVFAIQSRIPQSLQVGVRALMERYVAVLGFTPSLRTRGPVDTLVPQDLVEHVLAVLREALSNVARHARATRVALDIEVIEGQVLLRVADDGAGLPDRRAESGLKNVRRRAHELGGIVTLCASDPHGTTIEWRVPLRPATGFR